MKNIVCVMAFLATSLFSFPALAEDDYLLWGALAAGLGEDSTTLYVKGGTAINYRSAEEAKQAALDQCWSVDVTCKVVGTFSVGCGYITSGKGTIGDKFTVRWGVGMTELEALESCQSTGLTCDWPKGGCLDYPDPDLD